jgi:hypothetical protein
MTPEEKRAKLCLLIELHISCGYDFKYLIGRPLSYFDFNKVEHEITRFKAINDAIHGTN